MLSLREKLPSLNALMTFEAAARHRSFTRAASELCVSQAAVSRQIHRLESQLGIPLFVRAHRAVKLTPAGERLHHAVTMGLQHIATTALEIGKAHVASGIRIAATVAFAAFWLMPRLNEFRARHPDIEVQVTASDRSEDLFADDVDIALVCGDRYPPGRSAYFLFTETTYPVCSPAYLESTGALLQPADLLEQRLLHLDPKVWQDIGWDPIDWALWLEHYGISRCPTRRGLTLNNYPMLVQAALEGQGIALGWEHLVGELVRQGRLVKPLATRWDSSRGFYLLTSEDPGTAPQVAALRDWILASVSSTRGLDPAPSDATVPSSA